MSKTKEERFILALYNLANKQGDIFSLVDCKEVGVNSSQSERNIKTSVRILTHCNFIRQEGDSMIVLTKGGYELVSRLMGEKS